MREPAEIVRELEAHAELPPGSEERFFGYGVMGLPFKSGHLLGLRRFPASSIGPGYRSVWHRAPDGRWTFYQDQPPEMACTRYFGDEVDEVREGPIEIEWTGPRALAVRAGDLPHCRTRAWRRPATTGGPRAERAALSCEPSRHLGRDPCHGVDRPRRP